MYCNDKVNEHVHIFLHVNCENTYCRQHHSLTGKCQLSVCLLVHYTAHSNVCTLVFALLEPFAHVMQQQQPTLHSHLSLKCRADRVAPPTLLSVTIE